MVGPDGTTRTEGARMDGWTVTIDATTRRKVTTAALERVADALAEYGAAVSGEGRRLSVTVSIEDPETRTAYKMALSHAYSEALGLVQEAVDDRIVVVGVHARTFAEHDRELVAPAYPELVGVAELAALLDVSPQRASAARSKRGFPAPVALLASGPVWVKANVAEFAKTWNRSPGRPRKEVAK